MSYLFADMAPEVKADPVSTGIIARPYQTAAIEAAFREWQTVNATLIVLPTGTGKSIVFAKILKRWLKGPHFGRVMILAHRKELIAQAREHALAAGASCEIEMATNVASDKCDVVAASVQTLNAARTCFDCEGVNSCDCHTCEGSGRVKRMTRFDPREIGLVITDEGHHGTAASYMDVYTWFGSNRDSKRLFVTATPERSDNQGLHNVCESVAYEMGLRTAIDEGWLCPIQQQFIEVDGLDLSRVSTRQGDLADGELERAFLGDDNDDAMLHSIAKPVLETADGQQFIVFASGVEHANRLQAAFNAYDGARVETILGSTDPFERQRIVERLRTGVTRGLVNVGVATEGFDCPAVAVVAIARPTKSTPLYLQMIGRGTRPLPGIVDGPETAAERRQAILCSHKKTCVVMDFVGNSGRHKLVSVADVLAGDDVDARDLAEAIRIARTEQDPVDMDEAIEKARESREAKEREAEERRRISTQNRADRVSMTSTDVDLFDGNSFDAFRDYQPSHPNAATQKQVNFLVKLGVSPNKATNATKRQAGAMISSLTSKRGGDYVVTFGKYAGNPLRKIPAGWMNWALSKPDMRPELLENIREFRSQQP